MILARGGAEGLVRLKMGNTADAEAAAVAWCFLLRLLFLLAAAAAAAAACGEGPPQIAQVDQPAKLT